MNKKKCGIVKGVTGNLISIEVSEPISQNEVCYILLNNIQIMAEVIRVSEAVTYAQVYESTRGIKVGDEVIFMGNQLEVTLGPGMLERKYDGLQNDLESTNDLLLERGWANNKRNLLHEWHFIPSIQVGNLVKSGQVFGSIKENWLDHKIMIPFDFKGVGKVLEVHPESTVKENDFLIKICDESNQIFEFGMFMKWPIKKECNLYKEKVRPNSILETGIRTIDIFNPLAEGGSGFIPGPFGCGKTVLLQSISRYATADIIIIIACGERANEVVDLINEFSELIDPRTGRKLIERTIMICNTSNMPVAAREASIYTGMSIAEYYRTMGLKVLVLADSTSRWAQALREISNRMEELPGPDAYPVDLSAIVSNYYSRAGFVKNHNDTYGSITLLGSVSPPGGNFKEPVTESTQRVARCFYALSQDRADRKRYPAVDTIDSYSKYTEYSEIKEYFNKEFGHDWSEKIQLLKSFLNNGKMVWDQMNILGDDNISIKEHITYYKSELIDFILLQQDAFDLIDASTPKNRQKYMVDLIIEICEVSFTFNHFEEVGHYFRKIISHLKQLNYIKFPSTNFDQMIKELYILLNIEKD